jgi:potassium efflux system protein
MMAKLAVTIAIFACLFWPGNVLGQTDSNDSTTVEILPIPVSEVTVQSGLVLEKIKKMIDEDKANRQQEELIQKIPVFMDSLLRRDGELARRPLAELSGRALENFRTELSSYKKTLAEWENFFVERGQKIAGDLEILDREVELWTLTSDYAREKNAPAVTMRRIASVIAELEQTQARLGALNRTVLTWQDQVAKSGQRVNDRLDKVIAAEKQVSATVWVINDVPLWQVAVFDTLAEGSSTSASTLNDDLKLLRGFVQEKTGYVALILLVFIGLVIFIFYVRAQGFTVDENTDEGHRKAIGVFLARPFSAASVITFFFILLSDQEMPRIVTELISLLVTIPVFRIVPGIINARIMPFFSIILGLFILLHVESNVQLFTGLSWRFILFAQSSILNIALLFIRMRSNKYLTTQLLPQKLKSGMISIAVLLAIGGFIANLIGMSELARLLTHGTIRSITYFLMLFVTLITITGFVSIALKRRQTDYIQAFKKRRGQIEKLILQILGLLALYFWLRANLVLFNIYDYVLGGIDQFFALKLSVGSVEISMANLFGFIFIIFLTAVTTRFIRLLLEEDILNRIKLPRGAAGAISMMTRYIIVAIGFLFALAAAGVDMNKFSIALGALGVGIGFGLQNIISNFISGIILAFERPIQSGDVVNVGANLGVVKEIGVRSSRIRTYEGTEVIIPNADLISKEVINWTLSDKLKRQEVMIKVAHGSDPRTVKELLEAILDNHSYVLDDPRPMVLYLGFGDYSLDFRLLFWTFADNGLTVKSDVALQIHDQLKLSAIAFPAQRHEVEMRKLGFPEAAPIDNDDASADGPSGHSIKANPETAKMVEQIAEAEGIVPLDESDPAELRRQRGEDKANNDGKQDEEKPTKKS